MAGAAGLSGCLSNSKVQLRPWMKARSSRDPVPLVSHAELNLVVVVVSLDDENALSRIFTLMRGPQRKSCTPVSNGVRWASQLIHQVLGMDRLGKHFELITLCSRALQKLLREVLTGKEQNSRLRKQSAELHGQFDSVLTAQQNIGDEDLRRKLQGNFSRLVA